MKQWLVAEVLPQEHQDERLREEAYAWFRREHLEAPTPDRLTRLIRSAAHSFEQQLYEATLARLPEATQAALEALLSTGVESLQEESPEAPPGTPEDSATSPQPGGEEEITNPLHHLRMDPGRVGLATMLEEMAKLRLIRELKLPTDLFPELARKVLTVYRNRASIEEPSRLRAHPKAKRLTLLAALCFMRAQEITDGLVELLIQIVHKIDVRAEKRVEEEFASEFKRVANKEGILYRIAEASVEHPDEPVRKVIKVRVREIWIVGANRFRNPDDDLPTDFSQKRETYYEALRQPTEAERFVEQIKEDMRKALRSLDGAMPRIRDKVRLLPNRKKKPISITPLAAQPEPHNLLSLKREVGKRWPNTALLDILKETALQTGFPDLLTSAASRERLPRDVLHRRLILCLYF